MATHSYNIDLIGDLQNHMKIKIAIFASGGGSNAEEIIKYFASSEKGQIALIVTNNEQAGVIDRAKSHGIPYIIHTAEESVNGVLENKLAEHDIKFIVLAGYLKMIQPSLVKLYPNRIVNIHPALLPKFGGKGMYGMNVHRAVVEAKERKTGITIHFVNEKYDEGNIIEQHQCLISLSATAEYVQGRVLELEHKYFAPCIERIVSKIR